MIKYLLYNGADVNKTDDQGVSPRDMLLQQDLGFLIENIGEGYESSTVKTSSSKSKRSPNSEHSNSSSMAQRQKKIIVIQDTNEESVDEMFNNIRSYFNKNPHSVPQGENMNSSLAPPSSFNTSVFSSQMSDANQIGAESHNLPNFMNQVKEEVKGPGQLMPGNRSRAFENLQKLKSEDHQAPDSEIKSPPS